MDQFEKAMVAQGIPYETINRVKISPVWINEFKQYSQSNVDAVIYLFPMIYKTVVPYTKEEIEEASKNYIPMDLS